MKQQQFWKNPDPRHGGGHRAGKLKTARTIAIKNPMHVTFKATRARGAWSFHRFDKAIEEKIYALAQKYRVRIRLYQNVGNHLHMAAQARTRREFQRFLRVVPQAVAFLVTGARKGNAIGKFWDGLVHTRVIHWGQDWFNMKGYISRNRFEAAGAPRDLVDKWCKEARAAWYALPS
ncbi:MAG: hypothetical protein ACXWP1_01050 [Bdellovibrionota bacterium]